MQNSTWSNALLAALASLALVCTPIPALAQHGGGHGGGGGGSHGGGFSGGGFHGGSGGFHSGGFSGAHAGSFGYGSRGASGSQGGRGSYGMRSGSSSMSRSSRPWASEGQGVRNTSPGWHGFERSAGGRQGAGGSSRAVSGLSGAGAGRASMAGRSASTFHSAIADGQWHSFGAAHGANSLVAANVHTGFNSFHHATFVSTGFHGPAFYGGYGCCAFGIGFGWGWGWGSGWGWGWGNPFWAWPSYWYNPWWYGYSPQYIYPNP